MSKIGDITQRASTPRLNAAFAAAFARGEELGARFSAYRDGVLIADIWGGFADRARETPFTDQSLVAIYSSGKAVIATLIARAVSEGALDYDAPVARYWPEFAAAGKESITLAEALSHQSGLCGFEDPIDPAEWADFAAIASRLAGMAPLWPPGTASGYGPQTIGFIAGEILRRATGRGVAATLRTCDNAFDIRCALEDDEIARAAQMMKPPRAPKHRPNSRLTEIAFLKPWSAPSKISPVEWARAEIPASNMHATAEALARFVYPLGCGGLSVDGARVIGEAVVAAALRPRIEGADLVLPLDATWAAGLMGNSEGQFGPEPAAWGHAGFGGSAVVVDPVRRLSFAYTATRMSPSLYGDPRFVALADALYADF